MGSGGSDIRLGILGVSHGHPYSMASFFNGYDAERLRRAYPNIAAYLEAAPAELRRIPGARVESIWAEDPALAEHAAAVARIPNVARRPEDLVGRVDAVLVTENDGARHLDLAGPFLERGVPVFIDKPLADAWEDVREIWRRSGADYPLLCCSNLRYNPELDTFRRLAEQIGEPILVRGLSAMDWSGYGWHLAEVLVGLWGRDAASVELLGAVGETPRCEWRDGAGNVHAVEGGDWTVEVRYPGRRRALLQVFHPMAKKLEVTLHGSDGHLEVPLRDYFTMMRRLLVEIVEMVRSRRPPAGVMDDTLAVARIVTGARASLERGGRVDLEELAL